MTKPDHSPHCCKIIHGGSAADYRLCSKRAKVERDGKPYCGIHDPVAMPARRQANYEAWKAKRTVVESELDRRRAAESAACRRVATEVLREGLLAELIVACEAFVEAWSAHSETYSLAEMIRAFEAARDAIGMEGKKP